MKRRIQIAHETFQVKVLRRRGKSVEAWCNGCAAPVTMVTTEQAALISARSQRELVRETETGSLHYRETSDWLLLICLNSLNQLQASERERIKITKNLNKGQ